MMIVAGLLASMLVAGWTAGDDPRAPASGGTGGQGESALPWYVIVNSPRDLAELWRKIADPDYAIVRPDRFAVDSSRGAGGGPRPAAPAWSVASVKVSGRIEEYYAYLRVDMTIVIEGSQPVWASIGLDDRRIRTVREGGRDLPVRMTAGRRWEVLLEGAGAHEIAVELRDEIAANLARKSLNLAVPEAPATALELDFPGGETAVLVGGGEDYGLGAMGTGPGRRLSARLTPRSRIEVSWTDQRQREAMGGPVLTAEGDVALEVDEEVATAQSTWVIRAEGGQVHDVAFRLDEQEELVEVRSDSNVGAVRPISWTREGGLLKARLASTRPGEAARVAVKTRRRLGAARRLVFQGLPIVGARRQTGAVSVAHRADLWVGAVASSSLKRIDPQKLPTELRARPDTHLAFEFQDQPFRLELSIEPSPPLYLARSRASVVLAPGWAISETQIEIEPIRGRIDELEFTTGKGLEVQSVGPAELVELVNLPGSDGEPAGREGGGRLRVRLSGAALDQKRIELVVRARQSLPVSGPVALGLVSNRQAAARLALYPARSLLVEVDETAASGLLLGEAPPSAAAATRDWIKEFEPEEGLGEPILLAGTAGLAALPVRVARLARELTHDTRLIVHASRQGLDLAQQTQLKIRHGALRSVTVVIPAEIGDRWEVLDQEIARREDLGKAAEEGERWRLTLSRPRTSGLRLTFRARLPIEPALDEHPRRIVAPCVAAVETAQGTTRVSLELDPELRYEGAEGAWAPSEPPGSALEGSGAMLEFSETGPALQGRPFVFSLRAAAPATVPETVVARQFIRSAVWGNAVNHRAWLLLESRRGELVFDLAQAARILDARLDGRLVERIELDSQPGVPRFRIRLSKEQRARPVLLEISYEASRQAGASPWAAPRLAEGGAVAQVIWEIRVPWNQVLAGSPPGWTDLNHWIWDRASFERVPWRTGSELLEWAAGSTSRVLLDDPSQDESSDSRRYVFSRFGTAEPFEPRILSATLLIAVCSGLVLAAGFAIMLMRPRFRLVWLGGSVLGLLMLMMVSANVVLLVVQSSFYGLVLSLLGLLIERRLERERRRPLAEQVTRTIRPPADSSLERAQAVGSDGSTEIRVRPASTTAHTRVESPAAREA